MKNQITHLLFVKTYFYLSLIFVFFNVNFIHAQLIVDRAVTSYADANNIVNNVFTGNGVTISNVSWKGQFSGSAGQIASFNTGANTTGLGISKGIVLSTGDVQSTPGPHKDWLTIDWYDFVA